MQQMPPPRNLVPAVGITEIGSHSARDSALSKWESAASDTPLLAALFASLAMARDRCPMVSQSGFNDFHKFAYAKESDVMIAVTEALRDSGLALIPEATEIDYVMFSAGGVTAPIVKLRRTYLLTHRDGGFVPLWSEWIVARTCKADGTPTEDWTTATKKVITSSSCFLWLQIFQISRGDDADDDRGRQSPHAERAPSAPAPAAAARDPMAGREAAMKAQRDLAQKFIAQSRRISGDIRQMRDLDAIHLRYAKWKQSADNWGRGLPEVRRAEACDMIEDAFRDQFSALSPTIDPPTPDDIDAGPTIDTDRDERLRVVIEDIASAGPERLEELLRWAEDTHATMTPEESEATFAAINKRQEALAAGTVAGIAEGDIPF